MNMENTIPQSETTKRPDVKSPVLVISKLYKSFGNNHVLVDFTLEINQGESVVVLGKSGSGKLSNGFFDY